MKAEGRVLELHQDGDTSSLQINTAAILLHVTNIGDGRGNLC